VYKVTSVSADRAQGDIETDNLVPASAPALKCAAPRPHEGAFLEAFVRRDGVAPGSPPRGHYWAPVKRSPRFIVILAKAGIEQPSKAAITGSPGSSSLCSARRSLTRVPGDNKDEQGE
jgi:hypothetical protein